MTRFSGVVDLRVSIFILFYFIQVRFFNNKIRFGSLGKCHVFLCFHNAPLSDTNQPCPTPRPSHSPAYPKYKTRLPWVSIENLTVLKSRIRFKKKVLPTLYPSLTRLSLSTGSSGFGLLAVLPNNGWATTAVSHRTSRNCGTDGAGPSACLFTMEGPDGAPTDPPTHAKWNAPSARRSNGRERRFPPRAAPDTGVRARQGRTRDTPRHQLHAEVQRVQRRGVCFCVRHIPRVGSLFYLRRHRNFDGRRIARGSSMHRYLCQRRPSEKKRYPLGLGHHPVPQPSLSAKETKL